MGKLLMAKDKVKGSKYGLMALFTKANGVKTWPMAKECSDSTMAESMKEISRMTGSMDMASSSLLIRISFTKESSMNTYNMAMERKSHSQKSINT